MSTYVVTCDSEVCALLVSDALCSPVEGTGDSGVLSVVVVCMVDNSMVSGDDGDEKGKADEDDLIGVE